MVDEFERRTDVQFQLKPASSMSFSDYYPDAPGSQTWGRSLRTMPFDGRRLGSNLKKLGRPLRERVILGLPIARSEVHHFLNFARHFTSTMYVVKKFLRHGFDMLRYGRGMWLVDGNALVGRLFATACRFGIPISVSTQARKLIISNGRICGAIVSTDVETRLIRAKRGVVLACGGFARDRKRKEAVELERRSGRVFDTYAPIGNSGDGIRLAETVGALISDGAVNDFEWVLASRFIRSDGSVGLFPHSTSADLCKPGYMLVSNSGHRFVNECRIDVAEQLIVEYEKDPTFSAFIVCDKRAIQRFGLGVVRGWPLPKYRYLRSGYLFKGRTWQELAAKSGIGHENLLQTIEEFNRAAAKGEDPIFFRGASLFDRVQGDSLHGPNPCLGPLASPPYFAVKVEPATIGTTTGVRTNCNAQALSAPGRPIDGLYAVGSDMGSPFGGAVMGAGISIGLAMTFGYVAGRHLAGIEALPRAGIENHK
jgi:hypothetical protein